MNQKQRFRNTDPYTISSYNKHLLVKSIKNHLNMVEMSVLLEIVVYKFILTRNSFIDLYDLV